MAASTASAKTPADSRSSLITSALSIFHLRGEKGQRPALPASVFNECVFQIQIEHLNRERLQGFDRFALSVVVADEHDLEPVSVNPATDDTRHGRRFRRITGKIEHELPHGFAKCFGP